MRLKTISLSKLLKSELLDFVDDVVEIMDSHDVSTLYIENTYGMLLRHQPQIETLAKVYGPCPIVANLNDIHDERLEYAGFIFNQVISIEKFKGNILKKEALVAKLIVLQHLQGIRKHNRSIINGKLWGFFNAIDNDAEAKEAFHALGLHLYVEKLREINQLYHEVDELKQSAKTKRQKHDENKRIQNKGEEILRIFFAQLEQAQETYPELEKEYAELYAALNRMIPRYTKLIRTRATLNKKRAAAKAKAVAEAEAKVHILSVNGKESGSMTLKEKGRGEEKKRLSSKKGKQSKQSKKKSIIPSQNKKSINPSKIIALTQTSQLKRDLDVEDD